MVGDAEAAPLVAVGVGEVVGEARVEPRRGDVVHVAGHDERHRALGYDGSQLGVPLLLVLEHRLFGLAQGAGGGAVYVAASHLRYLFVVVGIEGVGVHVHVAEAHRLVAVQQFDHDFLPVDGLDIGDGEAREDGRATRTVFVSARAYMVVVAHGFEAVGNRHSFGGGVFLQAEHVGLVFAHKPEEFQREGVAGVVVDFGAGEGVQVVGQQGEALGVLVERRRCGGAAQAQEEQQHCVACANGSGRDEEWPAARQQPSNYEQHIQRQHGQVAVGCHSRKHTARRRYAARQGGQQQPDGSQQVECQQYGANNFHIYRNAKIRIIL